MTSPPRRQLSFSDVFSASMREKIKAEADKFAEALPDLIKKTGPDQEYYSAVYQMVLDSGPGTKPELEVKRPAKEHPGLRGDDDLEITPEQARDAFLRAGHATGIKEFDRVTKQFERKAQKKKPTKTDTKILRPLYQGGFEVADERQQISPPTSKVGRRTEQLIGNFSALLYAKFKVKGEAEVEAMMANGTLFVSANSAGTVNNITGALKKEHLGLILARLREEVGTGKASKALTAAGNDINKVLAFLQAMNPEEEDDVDRDSLSRLGRIDYELGRGPAVEKNRFIELLTTLKQATQIVEATGAAQAATFLSSGTHAGRIVTVPGEDSCHAEQNLIYAVILAKYTGPVQIAGMRRACTGCWMSYKLATEIGRYDISYNPRPGMAWPTTVHQGLANIANALKIKLEDLQGLFEGWLTGYNQHLSGKPGEKASSGREPSVPKPQHTGTSDASRRSYSRSPEPSRDKTDEEDTGLRRTISRRPRPASATAFEIAYISGGRGRPNPDSVIIKSGGEDVTIGGTDDSTVTVKKFPKETATLSFDRDSGLEIRAQGGRIFVSSMDGTLSKGSTKGLEEGDEFIINGYTWKIRQPRGLT